MISLLLVAQKLYFSEPKVNDMTALEVEVKGECVPLEVIVQPYAVYIPGQVMVETSVKRPLRVRICTCKAHFSVKLILAVFV